MQDLPVLGDAPGQPSLRAGAASVALTAGSQAMPEVPEAAATARPVWRHPAFIVSIVGTVLAVAATVVLLVIAALGGGASVTGASIEVDGGNLHLQWQADAPVQLLVVTREQTLDVSQLVVETGDAWVPAALGLADDSSCFVIRPLARAADEVTLDAGTLAAQGAASVCARDAAATP